jgi:hypothetical protein
LEILAIPSGPCAKDLSGTEGLLKMKFSSNAVAEYPVSKIIVENVFRYEFEGLYRTG